MCILYDVCMKKKKGKLCFIINTTQIIEKFDVNISGISKPRKRERLKPQQQNSLRVFMSEQEPDDKSIDF